MDEPKYSTYGEYKIKFYFGGQSGSFSLNDLKKVDTNIRKGDHIILESGVYRRYETYSGEYKMSYGESYRSDKILEEGELESGNKIITHKFKRIDINHMLVTTDNGETYLAKGSVKIRMLLANGEYVDTLEPSMPTRHGIYVPTGYKYEIKVTAETRDDTDTYTATLDFSNL
ncbi:MAG: hypothetical protein R3B45_09505 [Bdellovibrionota bacterium]